MKKITNTLLLLATTVTLMFTSCGKDYDSDISSLNSKFDGLDKRVTSLESQATKINSDLDKLSVLATAVENKFYITEVKTTADGYELTLSNGRKIALQSGSNNTLTTSSAPNVSMTSLNGRYYWTIDGMLIPGTDGKPLQATGQAPLVRFNNVTSKWEISTNGGASYVEVNLIPISINETVLLQVINEFIANNKNEIFNEEVLYAIVSEYISSHSTEIFDASIMNTVIMNFVNSNKFDATIINSYIEKNFSKIVDVDMLVNVIISFINDNKTTIINNDVLYQVFMAYLDVDVNVQKIFTKEMIVDIINNYDIDFNAIISENIDETWLRNFIEMKIGELQINIGSDFDINIYKTQIISMVVEHIQKNYITIFTQEIFVQLFKKYYVQIFNDVDIRNYIVYNYTSHIINYYVNNVIKYEQTDIFVMAINQIIFNYFQITNNQNNFFNIFQNYIDIDISQKNYITIIYKGQKILIPRYGVDDRLSEMIQSIVYIPTNSNYINIYGSKTGDFAGIYIPWSSNDDVLTLYYSVTPFLLADIIAQNFGKTMTVKLYISYPSSNPAAVPYVVARNARSVSAPEGGLLQVTIDNTFLRREDIRGFNAMALYVKDDRYTDGTDYLTTFTPVRPVTDYLLDEYYY